jgi:1-deoxy-D-xylulose-5-phosphate synthase
LCGFASREESPHDPFGSGHASTSVSAALGMALARDMAKQDYHVIAVIGDGSLTGGMAFEALNHAGHLGTRLIVVLNDNGMSISPSTGALSRRLTRIRFAPSIQHAKQDAKRMVSRLPISDSMRVWGKRVKTSVKGLVVPVFWEELGFDYFGPFDGHDISQLETALSLVRDNCRGPILMHVVTQKGRGYPPAEQDAVSYHGVAPENTEPSKAPSYSKVFSQTMLRLLKENPKVVAISAAMLEGTGLNAAKREFPARVFDVGICEQHAVTLAAGLACQGYIPVVAVYSTFLQRAYDQLIHDVCIQKLPVVFAIDRAGIVGLGRGVRRAGSDLRGEPVAMAQSALSDSPGGSLVPRYSHEPSVLCRSRPGQGGSVRF